MKRAVLAAIAMASLMAFGKPDVRYVKMTKAEFVRMVEVLEKSGTYVFKKESVVLVIEDAQAVLPFIPAGGRQWTIEELKKLEPQPYPGQSLSFHKQPFKKEDADA